MLLPPPRLVTRSRQWPPPLRGRQHLSDALALQAEVAASPAARATEGRLCPVKASRKLSQFLGTGTLKVGRLPLQEFPEHRVTSAPRKSPQKSLTPPLTGAISGTENALAATVGAKGIDTPCLPVMDDHQLFRIAQMHRCGMPDRCKSHPFNVLRSRVRH